MDLFEIEREKCSICGLCVADCPGSVIAMGGAMGFPSLAQGGEGRCIGCGHCVAVCPTGAFRHRLMSPEQCTEIDKLLLPSARAVELLLKTRRSIRGYKDELLGRESLDKLMDVVRYAPSGHNLQPVSWIVVSGRGKLKVLGDFVVEWMRSVMKENPATGGTMKLGMVSDAWSTGVDMIMHGAPHIVIAHAPKAYGPLGHEGCLIALSHLELAAYSLNIGACWAGYFEMAAINYLPLRQALDMPEGNRPCGAMVLGRPKYDYTRIPLRKASDVKWF